MADYIVKDEKGKDHAFSSIERARLFAIGVLERNPSKRNVDIEKRLYDKGHYGNSFWFGEVYFDRATYNYIYRRWDGKEWVLKKDGSLWGESNTISFKQKTNRTKKR